MPDPNHRSCEHIDRGVLVPRQAEGCEECLLTGDQWVHLRACTSCGHVGCCDDSKNRHARKHGNASGHPVIQSAEAGERWLYCYVDDVFVDP